LEGANVRVSPREDDINVMHRYRDAVRVLEDEEPVDEEEDKDPKLATRPAAGYGVVLYPNRPAPSDNEAVHRSLQRLHRFQIGAVPLCPGEEDMGWQSSLNGDEVVPQIAGVEQVRALARVVAAMLAENVTYDDEDAR